MDIEQDKKLSIVNCQFESFSIGMSRKTYCAF